MVPIYPHAFNFMFMRSLALRNPDNKLFVGQLPYSATEDEIRELFVQYGALREVILLKKSDGSSQGSCFVKFENKEDMTSAITALNEQFTMPVRYM